MDGVGELVSLACAAPFQSIVFRLCILSAESRIYACFFELNLDLSVGGWLGKIELQWLTMHLC